ncbi:hypothetical protein C7Y72_00310 [Paraconexibacter algicola]|uniref:Methylenetetrahydrofolate reductase n=1 Tax=Paraconexibacter algicola TaxID=2133960 RepID=A0A2T4UG35_9ACTN|nr:hypothetical protein C7Y72_00310 [Paraconexibacter algicola]
MTDPAQQLLLLVAEQLERRRVGELHPPVRVDDVHRVRDARQERLEDVARREPQALADPLHRARRHAPIVAHRARPRAGPAVESSGRRARPRGADVGSAGAPPSGHAAHGRRETTVGPRHRGPRQDRASLAVGPARPQDPGVSRFADALAARTLLSAELTPPLGADPTAALDVARTWAGCDLDAAQVNDHLCARVRMSGVALAALLRGTRLETVLHVGVRHRNRIAVQADLLGAHAIGVRDLVVVPGHDVRLGPDPHAREARDLKTSAAIALVRRLADEGRLSSGYRLAGPLRFRVGAVEAVGRGSTDELRRRIDAKAQAGAHFLQLQGLTDADRATAVLDALWADGVPERVALVASIVPVRDAAHRAQLARIPGVAGVDAEGSTAAAELGRLLLTHRATSGLHLRPLLWEDAVPPLVAAVRAR